MATELQAFKYTLFGWSNRALIALRVAVVLLLVLVLALFIVLHQDEEEIRRKSLIADILWLEQSIGLHLETSANHLQELSTDIAQERNKPALFRLRAENLLKTNLDLLQVVWLDAKHQRIASVPPEPVPFLGSEPTGEKTQAVNINIATKLEKIFYSDAYAVGTAYQFEVYSPIVVNGQHVGTLVGVYSFDAIVKYLVPWWFSERYQVSILGHSGQVLARRAKPEETVQAMSYAVSFDPPGFGMMLKANTYRDPVNQMERGLTILVVLLSFAALFSLWGLARQIRQRLVAEEALRTEHAFRQAMEDSLTIGTCVHDLSGVIKYANPALCQMLGYREEALIGLNLNCFDASGALIKIAQGYTLGQPVISDGVELDLIRENKTRFSALIYGAPLIDAHGRYTGWMSSIIDVTGRKRAETLARQQQEKLQQTSRLVTMGELASSLAHELNQPLAAITSYNTGCLNRLASDDFSKEDLRVALEKLAVQARRAGHIVRHVHEFVRKSEPQLSSCNLVEIIQDSLGFIETDARLNGVCLLSQIEESEAKLFADRVMLEQVLLNLMRNAIDAMSMDSPPGNRLLRISMRAANAEQWEILVVDNGPGIPESVREHLFTPFFTTKKEGMGMGLNICRSIIEFHRGRLWVEENPEGGTIFGILLPAAI